MQYRNQGIAGIRFNSQDKLFIYPNTASTKFLKFSTTDTKTVIIGDTQENGLTYLKEVSGKHETTPIARQAADLTEGDLSCNAAFIYKIKDVMHIYYTLKSR